MKVVSNLFCALLAILLLSSCGGGGGGGGDSGDNQSDLIFVPQNENADGMWIGNITNPDGDTSPALGILHNGEFVVYADGASLFLIGTYDIDQDEISLSSRGYNIFFGNKTGTVTFNGVVYSQGTMLASTPNGSSLALDYLKEGHELSISYEDLVGTLGLIETSGLTDLSINSSGQITNDDSDDCVFSGNIKIPNPLRNLLKLNISSTGNNCTFAGDYSGLGAFVGDEKTTYIVFLDNGTYGYWGFGASEAQ